jgi:hypothetical protein
LWWLFVVTLRARAHSSALHKALSSSTRLNGLD